MAIIPHGIDVVVADMGRAIGFHALGDRAGDAGGLSGLI